MKKNDLFENFIQNTSQYNKDINYFFKQNLNHNYFKKNPIELIKICLYIEMHKNKKNIISKSAFTEYKNYELYKSYLEYLNNQKKELFVLKLDISINDLDYKIIFEILKCLNTINNRIACLLKLPKESVVFKLQSIEQGSIILTILQSVIINVSTNFAVLPFCQGLFGEESTKKIKDAGELLRMTFFKFITTPNSNINKEFDSKLLNAKNKLFKILDDQKNLKSVQISNNKKTKTIPKNKIVDYYA